MYLCGLSCSSLKVSCPILSVRGSSSLQVPFCFRDGYYGGSMTLLFRTQRLCWKGFTSKQHVQEKFSIRSAMDASFGNMAADSAAVFPRINIRDPYKRLGISREASEEEIQAARNFLINKYAGHKPSIDAIESAHDKIIMQKFYERKNPKINVKKKFREVSQSKVIKAIVSRFEAPSDEFIIKIAAAFLVLGVLTVLFPTEEGPTLQVAISLMASMYFIYSRLKNRIRAFLYGYACKLIPHIEFAFYRVFSYGSVS
ncbi:protein CHAPERONE-LIKE PROTEIN OF POR1, chloroplastic [Amborella trichopoda]|nr:protein CHAPERONE-LIKE PROTEIN OF POR1, chloroplastic [Amborella trichopoda]|eukprot:XP_006836026.2 protein CHAPERONE-LIKE PROTEIN OF POR1, chloroplastic [Amborella trichopoda]